MISRSADKPVVTMNCPGCAAAMAEHTLAGHMGGTVRVDLCQACQSLWFDGFESLQLTPASTAQLFSVIGAATAAHRPAPPGPARCPRCSLPLHEVEDRQRTTRFRYRRCPRGHGRLISFLDFLREKDIVRPLSPSQLAELRERVGTVNCASCGAPIDLARSSACEHCGAPLSLIDLPQAREPDRV